MDQTSLAMCHYLFASVFFHCPLLLPFNKVKLQVVCNALLEHTIWPNASRALIITHTVRKKLNFEIICESEVCDAVFHSALSAVLSTLQKKNRNMLFLCCVALSNVYIVLSTPCMRQLKEQTETDVDITVQTKATEVELFSRNQSKLKRQYRRQGPGSRTENRCKGWCV